MAKIFIIINCLFLIEFFFRNSYPNVDGIPFNGSYVTLYGKNSLYLPLNRLNTWNSVVKMNHKNYNFFFLSTATLRAYIFSVMRADERVEEYNITYL